MNAWPLVWSHGRGAVEALGGMLGPVEFLLPGGRFAQPFAVFPWADELLPRDQPPLTGLMSRGRGEWPCVPFGVPSVGASLGWEHPIHGEPAHGLWHRIDAPDDDTSIRLRFACAAPGPVESLERHVSGIDGEPAIECRLIVRVRRPCALPIGLHPTLRVPARPGALRVDPGPFAFGRTFPRPAEPGADIVASDRDFAALASVPRQRGGTVDLSALPLAERTESLVQLCGASGHVRATNVDEGYAFVLDWDATQLPSCLLWISNTGRSAWPWGGRHYALGIEPICSAHDLGVAVSAGPNAIADRGIATALHLDPGTDLDLRYRMSVEPVR